MVTTVENAIVLVEVLRGPANTSFTSSCCAQSGNPWLSMQFHAFDIDQVLDFF